MHALLPTIPVVADPALAPIVAVLARARRRQQQMLRAHCRAPGHRITAPELAMTAGCRHVGYANRWYGQLGRDLFGLLPTRIDRWTAGGRPVFTTMLALDVTPTGAANRVWQIRPDIVRAAELLGFI